MRLLIIFSVLAFVALFTAAIMALIAFIPAGLVWLILAAFNVNVSFWLVWGIATLIGLIVKA